MNVRVCYDHGASWWAPRRLRALGNGSYQVLVKHPSVADSSGYVSLRVRAWDAEGTGPAGHPRLRLDRLPARLARRGA